MTQIEKFLFNKGLLTIARNREREQSANYNPHLSLMSWFVFARTPEGQDFWMNLHKEYKKQLK